MARRSKKKKEMDLIEGLLMMSMVGTFFLIFNWTKSMKTSLIAAGLAFSLVIAILIYRRMLNDEKIRKSGITDIDKMDGRQFEHYLGQLFKGHGYIVNVTKSAGDYGADLVISKDGKKTVVQAKRYSKNVGLKAVQEAHSSITYYGASEAWVVSNSNYTVAAISLAKSNNVRLITRNELIEMILKMNPGSAEIQQVREVTSNVPKDLKQKQIPDYIIEDVNCSRCGANMIRRSGPRGEFLGCGNFPKCRNTVTLAAN
jgi:restriction system protein